MGTPVYVTFVAGEPAFDSVELKAFEYWDLIHDHVVRLFDKVSSDQIYGVQNCKNTKQLMLYKQLEIFLSIICQERIWDAENDPYGFDLGNEYYIVTNHIVEIKKALRCRMDKSLINTIFTIFGLYDLNVIIANEDKDGIGYMGIEAVSENVFRVF